MVSLFSAGARAQVRTFLAAFVVLVAGIFVAPNLGGKSAVATAVLIGTIALIVRTVQAWKATFSFVRYLGHPFGDWADSFAQGFLGALVVTLAGWWVPDLHTARAFLTAAVVGAFNVGVRAAQGSMTAGEHPAPAVGINDPEMPYSYAATPE